MEPTFCGIFVCGPLQSFVVNVCTLILNANFFLCKYFGPISTYYQSRPRSAADKMLLEQYKVATLDYSYIVSNFPLGYGRLATSFPRSPLLLFYEMILETRVRVLAKGFNKSGQRLIKNWDYLLEIFYRIEQWPSQCVVKSFVVAKIRRFERVRASAYISLDVSFMVTLWNHGIPSRPRSCSLFFISIC